MGQRLLKLRQDKRLPLILTALMVIIVCTILEGAGGEEEETTETAVQGDELYEYIGRMEEKLAGIIADIDGAGTVSVMITVNTGTISEVMTEGSAEYESDEENYSHSEEKKAVYRENGSLAEPFVTGEKMPEICGVAVVATGAGDIYVKQKIIELVKALFNLDVNKISVTG